MTTHEAFDGLGDGKPAALIPIRLHRQDDGLFQSYSRFENVRMCQKRTIYLHVDARRLQYNIRCRVMYRYHDAVRYIPQDIRQLLSLGG